ncbi:MAG: sensor histidine kinase [Flavobacteriales bacterium]|nr:sensor histidine kinase [Flavobacteriales bacterium]
MNNQNIAQLSYEELEATSDFFFQGSITLLILAIVFLVLYLLQRRKTSVAERELTKALARYRELELETLKFQMHPHTFRNTLTSIKHFADKTNRSLDILTDVLDYILYDSASGYVSLKQESKFLKRFIEFHQVQSDNRVIHLKTDLGSSPFLAEKKCIAPLITAYFLENAIKHGDLTKSPVQVDLTIIDNTLNYHVTNAIAPASKLQNRGGIGQQNMRKRLDMIYGDNFQLSFKEAKGMYSAYLRIDLSKIE